MSDQTWVLRDVPPETRQQIVDEAQRRGVSVSEYLSEILLAGPEPELESQPEEPAPTPERYENFAYRHRLESLERRLARSVAGVESAIHSLDGSVLDLTARLSEAESFTDGATDALNLALAEVRSHLSGLRKRLADAENSAAALAESNSTVHAAIEERCDALVARLSAVEGVAYSAEAAGRAVAAAHEALKRAVAEEFSDFAEDNAARTEAAVQDMRAIAEDSARHADEAVARALEALRSTRETLEGAVADHAVDTHARMNAAFSDAAERLAMLAERVVENEHALARANEHIIARIIDAEDAAQTALEETAETLRHADAALAAQILHLQQRSEDSIAAVHHELSASIGELTERQIGAHTRVKALDATLASTAADLAAAREALEQRAARADAAWDARFENLLAHVGDADRVRVNLEQSLSADIARVESCTFASLEKLAGDIKAGDSALSQRFGGEIAELRGRQTSALARLTLIDKAIGASDLAADVNAGASSLTERVAQLEFAVRNAETEQALAAIRVAIDELMVAVEIQSRAVDRIDSLREETEESFGSVWTKVDELDASRDATARSISDLRDQVHAIAVARSSPDNASPRLDALDARLLAQETQTIDAVERVTTVARALGRVTAQHVDDAAQIEDRLHTLELAFADLRLDTVTASTERTEETSQALLQRMAQLERRQADSLESLQHEIAAFIDESCARLAALESGAVQALSGEDALMSGAVEARLTTLEQRDLGADFDALRRRIEERILGVESRSVRALEQVAETVALIEKRFDPEAAADPLSRTA